MQDASGSQITQIDGGKIKTDSINADKLEIGEEDRTGSRILIKNTFIKIFDGNNANPRVHIGDLSDTTTD